MLKKTENTIKIKGDILPFHIPDIAAFSSENICYIRNKKRYSDEFTSGLRELRTNKEFPKGEWLFEIVSLDELNNILTKIKNSAPSGERLDSPTAKKNFEEFIREAAKANASDLRLIISGNETHRRMRIAQKEEHLESWSHDEGLAALYSAFNVQEGGSGNVTPKLNEFQSFAISNKTMSLPNNVSKLRVQTGFHETGVGIEPYLIARLFYIDADETSKFSDLGFDHHVNEVFQKCFIKSTGIVIIGGETGDGKSTTLARILEEIYDTSRGRKSIMTLEDPVEYKIQNRPGLVQIPLQSAGGREVRDIKYENALMNFLRCNPDVGMLGEIRDKVAGEQALHFASSGHSLLSTLHVNSANGILFKLIRMGLSPSDVSETGIFSLLVKQTLIQILCDCKLKLDFECLEDVQKISLKPIFKNDVPIFGRNSDGCPKCKNNNGAESHKAWWGYKRLQAVAEFIEPDDTYNSFVSENNPNGAKSYWLKPTNEGGLGGIELAQKMTELVYRGEVSPIDCLIKKGDLTKQFTSFQKTTFDWGKTNAA